MKRTILYLTALMVAFTACTKDDEPTKKNFYLSPDAMVYITPAQGVTLKTANVNHLTALEIVKQSASIAFRNESVYGDQNLDAGFSDMQRDTVSTTPKLMRWATDLLNIKADINGKPIGYYLVTDFIDANNIVYRRYLDPNNYEGGYDTIAYTPNATVKQMAIDIRKALADGDTLKAYNTFNEKMTFTPITGAEWQALKAQNLQ